MHRIYELVHQMPRACLASADGRAIAGIGSYGIRWAVGRPHPTGEACRKSRERRVQSFNESRVNHKCVLEWTRALLIRGFCCGVQVRYVSCKLGRDSQGKYAAIGGQS